MLCEYLLIPPSPQKQVPGYRVIVTAIIDERWPGHPSKFVVFQEPYHRIPFLIRDEALIQTPDAG